MLTIRFIFPFIFIYSVNSVAQTTDGYEFAIRYTHDIYKAQGVNLNICKIRNSRELFVGLQYNVEHYNELILFKSYPSIAKYYGLKMGYIHNIKDQKKFSVCYQSEFMVQYAKNQLVNDFRIVSKSILPMLITGPYFKLKLFKSVDLKLLSQVGFGYRILYHNYILNLKSQNGFAVNMIAAIQFNIKM